MSQRSPLARQAPAPAGGLLIHAAVGRGAGTGSPRASGPLLAQAPFEAFDLSPFARDQGRAEARFELHLRLGSFHVDGAAARQFWFPLVECGAGRVAQGADIAIAELKTQK